MTMIWLLSLFVLSTSAFSPKPIPGRLLHQHGARHQHYRSSSTTQRSMIVDPSFFFGADEMQAAVSHVHELIMSSSASSLLLSDAATATADLNDAVTSSAASGMDNVMSVLEAPETDDGGWWQAYLNIFKTALLVVHSTIDPPLRSLGVEHTWGISIALFTASVRALLVPLSVQQTKSAEYMKALKPYMNEIKEKFKNNKDMQNRATAKLMEDANQNPLAGCFVSLAQIPVFLGLYRGVRLLAQEGKLQEPFLWIPSLEGPVSPPDFRGMDWLLQGWTQDVGEPFAHPQLGWATTLAFLVMPVVLVIGQSITMRFLQPPIDENMSKDEKETMEKSQGFLKFLPLMIGFFSLQVPAGLTIYWFTSNIFTLSQSLAVRSYYKANPPKIELPDYWEALDDVANLSAEDRRKAAEAGISTGPSFEDLLDEARFHYLVPRPPLRADSVAWQRVQASSATPAPELQEWVAASGSSTWSSSSSSSTSSSSSSEEPSVTNPPFYASVDTVTAAASSSA